MLGNVEIASSTAQHAAAERRGRTMSTTPARITTWPSVELREQQVGQRDRAVGDIDHRMNDSALRIAAPFAQLDVRISTSSRFHRTDLKPRQGRTEPASQRRKLTWYGLLARVGGGRCHDAARPAGTQREPAERHGIQTIERPGKSSYLQGVIDGSTPAASTLITTT